MERIKSSLDASRETSVGLALLRARMNGQTGVFGAVSFAAILLVGANETLPGAMSAGGFVMVGTFAMLLIEPQDHIFVASRDVSAGLGDYERLSDLIAKLVERIDGLAALPGTGSLGVL